MKRQCHVKLSALLVCGLAAVLLAGCTAAKDKAAATIGEATPGVSSSVSVPAAAPASSAQPAADASPSAQPLADASSSAAQNGAEKIDLDNPFTTVFFGPDLLSEVDKSYLQYGVKTSENGAYKYFFCPYGKDQILYGVYDQNENKKWTECFYWLYSKDMVSRADFCKNIRLDTTLEALCRFDPHVELFGLMSCCTPAHTFLKEGGCVIMQLTDGISQMELAPYNIYEIIRDEDRPENVKSRISWENSVGGGAQ
jgi:archaellin